jgi:hypothetical protein
MTKHELALVAYELIGGKCLDDNKIVIQGEQCLDYLKHLTEEQLNMIILRNNPTGDS